MSKELVNRLVEFMENEARSCSMDFGCVTPEYVYRMWGGNVAIEAIAKAMKEVRRKTEDGRRKYSDGRGKRE